MFKHKNKSRYGNDLKTVLMILAGSAFFTLELIDEVFGGTKSIHKNKARHKNLILFNSEKDYKEAELQKFYSLLNRLKNQGLVKKKQLEKGSLWDITKKGLQKLGLISQKKKIDYDSLKDDKIKIITFDIPERERWKRAWLREALVALEFSMLHQSVWIGKNKIPEQFLEDLRDMNLLKHIHILEVSASGTFKEVS